jgi:RNA polymerase primary sigma factor
MDSSQLRRTIAEYRSAKQELVSSNMGLVHAVSRDFQRRPQYKDLTLDELIQEGSLGLIRAAELFDPARNLRFSTYATIWIKGAIQNQRIGQFVILPNQENRRWGQIRAAMRDLEKEGMKRDNITTKVIADRLGMDEKKVDANIKSMTSVSKVLSLDYKYNSASRSGESDGEKLHEAFLQEADLAETTHMRADLISALIANLSEREIQLIRLVYGLDGKEHKINAAARIMGMNKETCRLLHKTVLNKLKQAKEMESLQEYLLTVA